MSQKYYSFSDDKIKSLDAKKKEDLFFLVLKTLNQWFEQNPAKVPTSLSLSEVYVNREEKIQFKFRQQPKIQPRITVTSRTKAVGLFLIFLWNVKDDVRQTVFLQTTVQKRLHDAATFLCNQQFNITKTFNIREAKPHLVESRLCERFIDYSTEPFSLAEWQAVLRDKTFNPHIFTATVVPRLRFLGATQAYNYKNYKYTHIISDIHADPCRFLWLLGANGLIQPNKSPTEWSRILTSPSLFQFITSLRWVKKRESLLILGDLVDGKRTLQLPSGEQSEKNVSLRCNISREYLVQLLVVHLHLSALKENGAVYVCLGNHDVDSLFQDWGNILKQQNMYPTTVAARYACLQDIKYFMKQNLEETLKLRSNCLGSFFFWHKNLYFGLKSKEKVYYAAHAELCEHNSTKEAIERYVQTARTEQNSLRNLTNLPTFVQDLTKLCTTKEFFTSNPNFFWKRPLANLIYSTVDQKKYPHQIPKSNHPYNLICGHSEISQRDKDALKIQLEQHTKTIFVDKGLSECFGHPIQMIDTKILSLET